MCPLIFQYRFTSVSTHVVVNTANVTWVSMVFLNMVVNKKSIKYPIEAMVKYGGLSSLFVKSWSEILPCFLSIVYGIIVTAMYSNGKRILYTIGIGAIQNANVGTNIMVMKPLNTSEIIREIFSGSLFFIIGYIVA